MSESGIPIAVPRDAGQADGRHSNHSEAANRPNPLRFAAHVLEMIIVMSVGMGAGAAIFLEVVGGLTAREASARYPVLSVVVLAFSMTAPMVAWMRFRGHGARSCYEMALSMVLPAVLLVALYWLGAIGAPAAAYCCISMWAMIALMIFHHTDYGM